MSHEPRLRERKKSATRAALITAAIRQFRKRGFDAVGINEICADAEVAPRTFFRYFPAKESVVLHDIDVYKEAFAVVLAAPRAGESPWSLALRASLAVAREITDRASDLRPRLELIGQSPLLIAAWTELDRFWADHLTALFTRHKQPDPELLAGAVVGGLNAALNSWLADPARDPAILTERVFDLFVHRRKP